MRRAIFLGAAVAVAATLAALDAGDARPAQGPVGPHSSSTARCSPTSPSFVLAPPQITAYNATAERDWQYVAWRPNVWYWNGSEWVLAGRGQWLWSWAYDDSPAAHWYDYSGRYVGTTAQAQGAAYETFNVTGLGYYYYVSDEFYWYANARTAAAYDHLWVNSYTGGSVYAGFCYF